MPYTDIAYSHVGRGISYAGIMPLYTNINALALGLHQYNNITPLTKLVILVQTLGEADQT